MARFTYSLLRMVFGAMLALYGLQKFGLFGGTAAVLGTWPYGLAGPLEVVCGTLIALGLFSGPAGFVASGEMAVAYFYNHFPRAFLPVENDGQPAVLLCFGFLFIAASGSGLWSLDNLRHAARGSGRAAETKRGW